MRKMTLILPFLFAVVGCATVVPPPVGTNSSLIVGELKVEVSGSGMAPDGAHGFVSTDQPRARHSRFAMKTAEKSTSVFDTDVNSTGFFMLPNAEPGRYRLLELWCQVETNDSYVTLTSNFYKSLTFDLEPGRIVNLGLNRWYFAYDLSHCQHKQLCAQYRL